MFIPPRHLPLVRQPSVSKAPGGRRSSRDPHVSEAVLEVSPAQAEIYQSADEQRHRYIVARVAAVVLLTFLACAVLSLTLRRPIIPVPYGSGLIVEVFITLFPGVYWLAAVHDGVVAALCGLIIAACTVLHAPLPGNPRKPSTVIWRRQAILSAPSFAAAGALLILGLWFRHRGHPILSALIESVSTTYALRGVMTRYVPIFRSYLVVFKDLTHFEVGNRMHIGGGRQRLRKGSSVIIHEDLVNAEWFAGWIEGLFGLVTLRLIFRTTRGIAYYDIPCFGSVQLATRVQEYLMGDWKLGRTREVLNTSPGYVNTIISKSPSSQPPGAH